MKRLLEFTAGAINFLEATSLKPRQTSAEAPRQNDIAQRCVENCGCETPSPVISLNEQHLCPLIRDCVDYHHEDRIHESLEKDSPTRRVVEQKPSPLVTLISSPHPGGIAVVLRLREHLFDERL